MGLFNALFGNSEEKGVEGKNINWIPLEHIGQLDELLAFSEQNPVVIFKHSTRCSISRFALKQFEREFDFQKWEDKVLVYFLDLLSFRDISNEIESRFEVLHQSPQLLLIKNGKSVYDVSHSDIDALELSQRF